MWKIEFESSILSKKVGVSQMNKEDGKLRVFCNELLEHKKIYIGGLIFSIIAFLKFKEIIFDLHTILNNDPNNPNIQILSLEFLLDLSLSVLFSCFVIGILLSARFYGTVKTLKNIGNILLEQSIQGVVVGFVIVILAYLVTTAVDGSIELIEGNNNNQLENRIDHLEQKIENFPPVTP